MCKFVTLFARVGGLLLALGCCSAWSNTCRVTPSGTIANNGSTWAVPMDMQTALGTSACTEIWVAAGVYKPTSAATQGISFVIAPGTAVYGGFAGIELQRGQRDPGSNVTTLSGDIGTVGVATDNSWTVVKMIGAVGNTITASTVLDGFTIYGGHNSGLGDGLYCNGSGAGNECSPTLSNLIFDSNYSHDGGALYNNGSSGGISSPHLTNVTFINNYGLEFGGAMCNDGQSGTSNPVLNGVTFANNTTIGGLGGGMSDLGNSSPVLTNVTFSGNGGPHVNPTSPGTNVGGAICIRNGTGTLTLNNVTFSENTTPNGDGGAIDVFTTGSVVISNSIFWGDTVNAASTNPEIASGSGTVTITSSIVQGGCPASTTCVGLLQTDPMLGALQDNGGPTQTRMPMVGGSAVNAGYNPSCAATDQRGVPRPQGANCDIGKGKT